MSLGFEASIYDSVVDRLRRVASTAASAAEPICRLGHEARHYIVWFQSTKAQYVSFTSNTSVQVWFAASEAGQ
jgi:hypothetical protein